MSQLDKCLKFKSIRGDKNDCTLYKITLRNAINSRHLSSGGTIGLGLWIVEAYALALAMIKLQSQRMNRSKKAEGLNDVGDELEQFYTLNWPTFNKKITSSKVTYNGNEQFSATVKTRLDNCISHNKS